MQRTPLFLKVTKEKSSAKRLAFLDLKKRDRSDRGLKLHVPSVFSRIQRVAKNSNIVFFGTLQSIVTVYFKLYGKEQCDNSVKNGHIWYDRICCC